VTDQGVIHIEVRGIDVIQRKMKAMGKSLEKNMSSAALEASKDILNKTIGVRRYPPAGPGSNPPPPYYKRGYGMIYKSGAGRETSEKLGSRTSLKLGTQDSWTVKKIGYGVSILNNASYAPYVIGDQQSNVMKKLGWRNIYDVFKENIGKIKKAFDDWILKTLKDTGLK